MTATATGTGISVIPSSNYLSLGGGSAEMQEAMDSVSGETFGVGDLTRVKMPSGGGTTWEIPDGLGNMQAAREIVGVLVYIQKHGVLWPSFDPKPGMMPVLRSYDLVTAEQVGPIPDDMVDQLEKCRIDERHFNWEKCPYNEWGTGKNGSGKRCREQRMMFILRQGDLYPLVVTAQPGSLNNVRRFFLNMPKLGIPYWGAVVNLSLEKVPATTGEPFSRIVPKVVGTLDKEARDMVKERFYNVLESGVAKQMAATEPADGEGSDD